MRHRATIKRTAAQLYIDHRGVSRRIYRMNKRMEKEIGENIMEKHGHKWKLISRLRHDFAAAGGEEEKSYARVLFGLR